MSFDVFLQKFAAGEPAEIDRGRVQAVLQTREFSGPDEFGFYIVKLRDGVDVEFSAKGLGGTARFTGCAFHIHGMSRDLVTFILEIARAGDMVMLPAMEDSVPILSSAAQKQQLPFDLAPHGREPVFCESPAELESLFSGGYAGWQSYRDQISRRNRDI